MWSPTLLDYGESRRRWGNSKGRDQCPRPDRLPDPYPAPGPLSPPSDSSTSPSRSFLTAGKSREPRSRKRLALSQKVEQSLFEATICFVGKLDRLGRDLRHLVNTVHDLTARGIGFKVLTGHGASIDTTSPGGKLVFGIFAALAEFERELIIERTKAAMAAAHARGRNVGRPYKMTPSKLPWPWLP